ncbi:hypothetical protein HDV63DRAFT_383521 [Trichoderma sp. SZMC 28014]
METVGNTTSTSYAIIHALARATENAREFENEFERCQLRLDTLQVQLEAVRPIKVTEPIQAGETITERRERSLAHLIAGVQRTLSKVQEDVAKIRAAKTMGRMQWAIYKRDRCYRSIKQINALVADLERAAGSQH